MRLKLTGKNLFRSIVLLCITGVVLYLAVVFGGPSDDLLTDPSWYERSEENADVGTDWTQWYRPADNPVFTSEYGNNHDAITFHEPELEYPYYLIVSHEQSGAMLWRAKSFSWNSTDWELVDAEFVIDTRYEFDDGIKVDGTYYVYESGNVYTYSGPLEEASGNWLVSGSFPIDETDDIGVFYEDGMFHIFGEYGYFRDGPDGTSLAHYSSPTGLGDWKLIDPKAVDANPYGGSKYGIGDATIARIDDEYYIFSDIESKGNPYKVVAWKSSDLNQPFTYLGIAVAPRPHESDDWDNHRVQDCEIVDVSELTRYVMVCNMMDIDGDPGGDFPTIDDGRTRVVGFFYSVSSSDVD